MSVRRQDWVGPVAEDTTDEWYTPPELFETLGLTFDLDPAAPPGGVPWVPASRFYSRLDDGLRQPWYGRVWLNPPYGRGITSWLDRMAGHGDGLVLTFARTDARWFHRASTQATAICFVAGRVRFRRYGGQPGNPSPVPSVLLAYGLQCSLALANAGLGQTFAVPQLRRAA
jgi:hypothetical protein